MKKAPLFLGIFVLLLAVILFSPWGLGSQYVLDTPRSVGAGGGGSGSSSVVFAHEDDTDIPRIGLKDHQLNQTNQTGLYNYDYTR